MCKHAKTVAPNIIFQIHEKFTWNCAFLNIVCEYSIPKANGSCDSCLLNSRQDLDLNGCREFQYELL